MNDIPEQSLKVKALLEEKCSPSNPAFINMIVVSEIFWVLKGLYSFSKKDLINVMTDLLVHHSIEVENPEILKRTIDTYKVSNSDFVDCLILEKNKNNGFATTDTFDKKAERLDGCELL